MSLEDILGTGRQTAKQTAQETDSASLMTPCKIVLMTVSLIFWSCRMPVLWAISLLGCRSHGLLVSWAVSLIGLSVSLAVGLMGLSLSWPIGLMGRRSNGLLVSWAVFISGHWSCVAVSLMVPNQYIFVNFPVQRVG